jgi:hypothetical protein
MMKMFQTWILIRYAELHRQLPFMRFEISRSDGTPE